MNDPFAFSGTWEVDEKGKMTYVFEDDVGKLSPVVEPENLESKLLIYEFQFFPSFDLPKFFAAYWEACQKAGIEQITFRMK